MKQHEQYTGIDIFKIIAALMVIAIHTSPLSSYSDIADFALTRIVSRVAVPFFFMVTGFFVLSKNNKAILIFLKKLAIVYFASTLLYLPFIIYNGKFKVKPLLPQMLKDILFDGTFYHLWYLPAVMIGIIIAYLLLKKLSIKQSFIIASVLYIIGLFGDSYYGMIKNIPIIKSIYDGIFFFSDYTRNGLFFAPIFLIMGYILAHNKIHFTYKVSLIGLVICTVLLFTEGFILHSFQIQKHDSMYFMLIPCMFFLFESLLFIKGKQYKFLRPMSAFIYIIHPLMIIMVRGFAKITHMQNILIKNSLIFYLTVTVSSCITSFIIVKMLRGVKKNNVNINTDRIWAEISLKKLSHNVNELKNVLPQDCCFMAVVKANAYGHGDIALAKHLNHIGINAFAVATIDEGIQLRKHKIKGEILVLGYTKAQRAPELNRYHLIQTVADYEHAKELNNTGYHLKVHLKIDTGMHRLGENYEAVQNIKEIFNFKYLEICGIFTHLCASDSSRNEDIHFTHQQIDKFEWLLKQLKDSNIKLPKSHIQSSYGVLNYPELQYDYARIGIAMYGVNNMPDVITKTKIDLQPIMSIYTRIVLIREINAGESVGYDCAFVAEQNSRIAVLPVGYADGIPRSLSCNKGQVLIRGNFAPIIGLMCMDQMMVDITNIPIAKVGDIVTLIGSDEKNKITAEQVAANCKTITNEILSRLGTRIKKIYI